MNTTSSYLEDTLAVSKIADVINIETAGSVHVGHVINITEQIVLNANNNELEFNGQKKKDYTHHFTIIDRMHWLAQPSVAEIERMKRPAKYVIICKYFQCFSIAKTPLLLNHTALLQYYVSFRRRRCQVTKHDRVSKCMSAHITI